MTAGSYAVFARKADPSQNGGLPPVAGVFSFALGNSNGGRMFVGVNGAELDAVAYDTQRAGSSTSLDESDDVTWCYNTTDFYGPGDNYGTPGAANPTCP
jgi:hypothetical protein